MSTSALLTLIAIIASIENGQATLEGELLDYLRPGDVGRVQYEITVGTRVRTIDVGAAEVLSVGGGEAQVRVESARQVLPGFVVRFEVPLGRAQVEEREAEADLVETLAAVEADLAVAVESGRLLSTRVAELESELARARAGRPTGAVPRATSEQLEARVRAWAAAWSEQNIQAYLGFYAQEYRPANGISRRQWEAQRRERLSAPGFVEVVLEEFEVISSAAETAEVRFEQSFRSDTFEDRVTKTLSLVLEAGMWRISTEEVN